MMTDVCGNVKAMSWRIRRTTAIGELTGSAAAATAAAAADVRCSVVDVSWVGGVLGVWVVGSGVGVGVVAPFLYRHFFAFF